jgi:hypothetical protein
MIEIRNISILKLKFFNTDYQIQQTNKDEFIIIKKADLKPIEIRSVNKTQARNELNWLVKNMELTETDYDTLNNFLK